MSRSCFDRLLQRDPSCYAWHIRGNPRRGRFHLNPLVGLQLFAPRPPSKPPPVTRPVDTSSAPPPLCAFFSPSSAHPMPPPRRRARPLLCSTSLPLHAPGAALRALRGRAPAPLQPLAVHAILERGGLKAPARGALCGVVCVCVTPRALRRREPPVDNSVP